MSTRTSVPRREQSVGSFSPRLVGPVRVVEGEQETEDIQPKNQFPAPEALNEEQAFQSVVKILNGGLRLTAEFVLVSRENEKCPNALPECRDNCRMKRQNKNLIPCKINLAEFHYCPKRSG